MKVINDERCTDTRRAYAAKVGLPLAALAAVITFTCTLFSRTTTASTSNQVIDISCTPNGDIHVTTQMKPKSIDPRWDPSLFLSITLGFGSFNFGTAKGIDICWDLIVGRGGQILLVVLAYPVVRRSLSSYMERRSVHYRVYTSFAFDKISLATLYSVLRDLVRRRKFAGRSKKETFAFLDLHFFGITLVMVYVLAFPTMVSIMTGYQATFTPLVPRLDDNVLMRLSKLSRPDFVLVDGSRVGLTDGMPIYPGDPNHRTIWAYAGSTSYLIWIDEQVTCNDTHGSQLCWNPQNYGDESRPDLNWDTWDENCGFGLHCGPATLPPGHTDPMGDFNGLTTHFSSSNITLDGKTWALPAPPLNIITQIEIDTAKLNPMDTVSPIPPPTVNFLAYDDVSLNSTYLKEKSICQPSDRYQWGFSSLLLLVFCLLTVIFAVILNLLHGHAFWYGRADRYRYNTNHYRDAIDLVRELETRELGGTVQDLPARKLRLELERNSDGVCLETESLPLSRKEEREQRRQKAVGISDVGGQSKHVIKHINPCGCLSGTSQVYPCTSKYSEHC